MLLLSIIAITIYLLFAELSLTLAWIVSGFCVMLGCAGLALTCPRKLKDDSLFQADVL
jgi:hypothetical protein